MRNFLSRVRQDDSGNPLFGLAVLLGTLTTLFAIGTFGYLGIFSRYGSDDYCLSAFYLQKGSFLTWMVERYQHSSSRYTNILFIGLVDKLFGWYNVAILPPLMLALFVVGFYLLLNEIVQMASLGWNRLTTLFLATLIVYFSVVQAPNAYEILYWRAGMTSHFAPLVFLTFLGAFLLKQIRVAKVEPPSFWILAICFLAFLIVGGFSEPSVALTITVLVLAICGVWWLRDSHVNRSALSILFSALAGSLLALAILALSPANAIRLEKAPPGLVDVIVKTFKYPAEFLVAEFRSFPLPAFVAVLLPAALFLGMASSPQMERSKTRNRILLLIVAIALLAYLLIASSFAPSVYGQSFPAPRARFAAVVILTCALMMEGALVGLWIANFSRKFFQPINLYRITVVALLLLSLYPLRTVMRNAQNFPVYQQRALAWDLRDAKIRNLKAEGARDLVVPFLAEEIMQDLGDHAGFRLNRCASTLYGVNSIVAH